MSGWADSSEPSFQISNALGSTSQLLLEDDSGFLTGVDSALTTPAASLTTQSLTDNPLTLAELTPRLRRAKPTYMLMPSHRKLPLSSPLKHVVARDNGTNVQGLDDITPFKQTSDTTFQIPRLPTDMTQLLMSEDVLDAPADYTFLNTTVPGKESLLSPDPPTLLDGASTASDISLRLEVGGGPSRSQYPVLDGFLASQTSTESLAYSREMRSPVHNASSDVTPPSKVPTRLHADRSSGHPDNQSTGYVDVLEESDSTAARSAPSHPTPDNRVRSSGRRSTGKQTVIAGGIVKRSKLSSSSQTNTLRSKALGKRPAIAQRKRNTAEELKQPQQRATVPIRVTTVQSRRNSRKAYPTQAAPIPASYQQEAKNSPGSSQGYAKPSLPTTTHIARSDVPTWNMKVIHDDSAAVQPSRSNETSNPSTAVDRNLDQALNDDGENITHSQTSPSDVAQLMTTASTLLPEQVSYAQRNLAPQPDPIELGRDSSGMLAGSHTTLPSPLKRSLKRSASVASDDEAQPHTKRGRTSDQAQEGFDHVSGSADSARSSTSNDITRATTRVLRSSRTRNAATAGALSTSTGKSRPSGSRTAKATRLVKKPGAATSGTSSQPHTVNTGGSTGLTRQARQLTASAASAPDEPERPGSGTAPASSTSRSGDTTTTDRRGLPPQRKRPTTRSTHSASLNGQQTSADRAGSSQGHARLAVSLPAPKATVPIEFHFHSEARIEARKRSDPVESKDATTRAEDTAALGVPDFKALHDAEEKRLASRKHQIKPLLPGRVELSTEARAHEREKFEEARRAREAEAERLLEEQRRLQAVEEAKEVRELRRRAVPKANEVPDWYAHAPKLHKPREH